MTKSIELKISGMHCAGCVGSVESALRKVEGVQEAVVNLTLEKATITGAIDSEHLLSAVEKTGYGAELLESDTPINLQEKTDEKVDESFQNMKWAWMLTFPAMIWMGIHMITGIAWPSMEDRKSVV
mgnify:FL=1